MTVTNTGTAALSFTSITLGGTGSLLPKASCELQVTFSPDEKNKTVSATVVLTDSEGKQLCGIGRPPSRTA